MSNGPVQNRECTDLICCLVFLAFLVGMVGVSGYGLVYGDPQRFLIMWDADARGCGNDTAVLDYPYLYFPMINLTEVQSVSENPKAKMAELLNFSTCVKECPGAEGKVECNPPTFMKNNDNYAYEECTYSIVVTEP
jgi:choline transporter-like protein 2/4/5